MPLSKQWCICRIPTTFLIFLLISFFLVTKSEVIFKEFIFSIAESAVSVSETQLGFLLQISKIFLLKRLLLFRLISPSVIKFIFPLFSLTHTIPNFFFWHFYYSIFYSLISWNNWNFFVCRHNFFYLNQSCS